MACEKPSFFVVVYDKLLKMIGYRLLGGVMQYRMTRRKNIHVPLLFYACKHVSVLKKLYRAIIYARPRDCYGVGTDILVSRKHVLCDACRGSVIALFVWSIHRVTVDVRG